MTRVIALLVLLLPAGCHCSHKAGPGEGGEAIVVLVESEVGSLDPRFASSSYEIKISRLVHSGLMTADTEDLGVEPLLAESVEQVDDRGREWKVTLRPGLTFHDGAPVQAELDYGC